MRKDVINIIFLFFFAFYFKSLSQVVINNNPPNNNPEYLVNNILIGDGIIANNVFFSGDPAQIGYFDGINGNIGMDAGIVLSTGNVLGLDPTAFGGFINGVNGDQDLLTIANLVPPLIGQNFTVSSVNDVVILEFDFVPVSSPMSFDYVFTSSEYNSWENTQWNDVFGFFISGPGITGPYDSPPGFPDGSINIATFSNTELNTLGEELPITVSSVNFNYNSDFYITNNSSNLNNNFSGYTSVFTAEAEVICGETYHIKLAIADGTDDLFDSAIFLDANSFESTSIDVNSFNLDTEISSNTVLEGCEELNIQFDRFGELSSELVLDLSFSGDAVMGIDYEDLPNQITLEPNQDQFILPVNVLYDDIIEGEESIIVSVDGFCLDFETDNIELIIFDQDPLLVDVPEQIEIDCFGLVEIVADVSGGVEPYNYAWFDESGILISTDSSIIQSPDFSTSFSVEISDSCQNQFAFGTTNVEILDSNVEVSIPDQISLCQGDPISLNPEINGGVEPYYYVWYLNGSIVSTDINLNFDSAPEGLYQFIVQEGCGGMAADELMVSYIDPSPYVELSSNDVPNPALLPESCFQSNLDFILPDPIDEDVFVEFTTGGTATLGEDYDIESFELMIPAGETSVSVPIEILTDNIFEGDEEIEFYFDFIDECSGWPEQLTVTIYEMGNLYASAPEELIVCEDELDQYAIPGIVGGGTGLVNYGWYFNDELISTDINLPVQNLVPGEYTLMATDQCENIAQANVYLEFLLLTPTVELISESYENPLVMTEACGSSTLFFQMPYAYPNDTIFYYQISGTFSNGVDIINIPSFIEVPAGVTSVDLDIIPISDNLEEENETIIFSFPFVNECVDQNDVEIIINNVSPIILDVPEGTTVCAGQEVVLEGSYSGGVEPMTYFWTTPDGNESTLNLTTSPENDWEYTFNVVDACGYSASSSVFIQTEDYEPMEVLWPPQNVNACVGEQDVIIPDLTGGAGLFTFNWYVNGEIGVDTLLIGSDLPNMYIPTDSPDYFAYEMTVTDDCDNTISYSFNVNVVDCTSPNVFTPNGDGSNDYFALDFGTVSDGGRMEIFNRWGELVFKSENYAPCSHSNSTCWDGTYFNLGEVCPDGVYFYKLKYNNETTQKVGYVLLTR